MMKKLQIFIILNYQKNECLPEKAISVWLQNLHNVYGIKNTLL